MKTIIGGVLVLLLCGCETCRDHPAMCAIGASVAATSIALCAGKHEHRQEVNHNLPPICQQSPAACQ